MDGSHQDPSDGGIDSTDWTPAVWDREVVDRVWSFAAPVPGNDAALWRKDEWGAWIHRLDYGRRHSEFGWEIHDASAAPGGTGSDLRVLRPLHWRNQLDSLASQTQSKVTADGSRNVRRLL